MAQCSLGRVIESPCSEMGGLFLLFLHEWMWETDLSPCRASISSAMAFFCARAGWYCLRKYSLVSGRGQVRELTRDGSLEHENLRELDLGYVLVIHKLKNRSTCRNVNPVYKELREFSHS